MIQITIIRICFTLGADGGGGGGGGGGEGDATPTIFLVIIRMRFAMIEAKYGNR